MILDNGTIEVKTTSGGGLVNGIPQRVEESWSEPIECHIVANMSDNRGVYKGGTFKRSAYTVWLDSPLYHFKAERIRLKNEQGKVLGEFEVQSIEESRFTGRTKIVV
ncbi:hypothetical protein CAPN008_01380 [Capnocytophaga canis]|uniref:hypothetical protein n=1 Tax=Capnocytophaga canis TaxID=1848903 RepID=UPI001AD5C46E|nr:hypothetical protein [Capnocytophaga canis]GIM60088.1 hypothetical protein CAPN008_01380 [Capnocytophaga canis]